MIITGKYPNLRLRRNRKSDWSRRLVQENNLTTNDLVLPIFLTDGINKKIPIKSMPGIYRYTINRLSSILDRAIKRKIPMVALFPYTNINLKDDIGSEALNEDNLVCRAIRYIKNRYNNDIGIMCDVALDPYTSHGHDGILKKNKILNDETVDILVDQALLQAKMGCDVIAPSDMMDGRIIKIRQKLDKENLQDVQILSYAIKYASSFYGPFREAVGSNSALKGDKKTYQMDYRNFNESLREVSLDIKEGADMVIVKPGMPYLDIIRSVKDNFKIPIIAYQVSGEYSLIKNGIQKKIIDEKSIIESLMSFKRAGANAVITYFADTINLDLFD
jgi:porphobilinogen synthase